MSFLRRLPGNAYFWISFVLICVVLFEKYPTLGRNAQLFAENGTNFFYFGRHFGFFEALGKIDFVYLPLLQRLVSLAVLAIAPVQYYPHLTQLFAFAFTAFVCSFINLKEFREFLPSDLARFVLGLSVAFVTDYQLHSYVNFIYFGIIFTTLAVFIRKANYPRYFFVGLTILNALILISKPVFIVFFPIYFLFAVYWFREKNWREVVFFSAGLLTIVLQIIVMIANTGAYEYRGGVDVTKVDPFTHIVRLFQVFGASYMTAVFGRDYPGEFESAALNLALPWLLIGALTALVSWRYSRGPGRARQSRLVLAFFVCNALAGAVVLLHLVTLSPYVHLVLGDLGSMTEHVTIPIQRWTLASSFLIVFSLVLVGRMFLARRAVALLAVYLSLQFSLLAMINYKDELNNHHLYFSFADWKSQYEFTEDEAYVIPILPGGDLVVHNLELVKPATNARPDLPADRKLKILLRKRRVEDIGVHIKAVVALDETGREIGRAQARNPFDKSSQYLDFGEPLRPERLKYLDLADREIDAGQMAIDFYLHAPGTYGMPEFRGVRE